MRAESCGVKRLTAGAVGVVLAAGLLSSVGPTTVAAGANAGGSTRLSTSPAGLPAGPVTATLAARRRVPAHYRVASFNVLGWNHTINGGRGFAGAMRRMVWTRQLLNRHHIDVAGFQELQVPQVRRMRELTGHRWGLYPGLRLHSRDSENSVGWRRSKFRFVAGTTVNIPYFDGHRRAMPIVLLRHRASGMMTYFSNFHNPGETSQYRNQGRWRVLATRIEIALHNQLYRRGIPRIMTGDMNERRTYFCRVTRNGTPLRAARPGSTRVNGECRPGRPPFVDWIFGSKRIRFHNYFEAYGPLVRRTTDHPIIMTDVTVDPDRMPRGWARTRPAPFVARVSH